MILQNNFYLFFILHIRREYVLEALHQGISNEYLQFMFYGEQTKLSCYYQQIPCLIRLLQFAYGTVRI